jgi:hypothetical protein
MRSWPHPAKQSLRFLAAARFFLPADLNSPADLERQYKSRLRDADFQGALDILEEIGDLHSGYEHELTFWKELYYAAQHLELPAHAQRYSERIRQIAEMQRLQF